MKALCRPSFKGMSPNVLIPTLSTLSILTCLGSAACLEADEDCQEVTLLGGCADGSGGYSQPSPPRSLGAYLGDGENCPGQGYRCSIALAGSDTLAVGANGASNLELSVSPGFALAALPSAPVQPLAFRLRAPNNETRGNLQLASSNMPTVSEEIGAQAVYDVSVVAASGPNRYSRDNAAVPASAPRFVVALWSNEDSGQNPPYEPSRLIDTTLRSESSFVEQLAWDTFTISAAPGIHELAVASDSMGTFTLAVEVAR